jgi:hypothetical protein
MTPDRASDVWDALESSALPPGWPQVSPPATATRESVLNRRDMLMRFLEEIDGDLSVADVREALEDYQ